MSKSALDDINDDDLEKLGLWILKNVQNGKYVENDETAYIQIVDKNRILDDGTFRCHFELLRIYEDKKDEGHEKNKIYVEIHFEEPKCNKYFNNVVTELLEENKELESFPWYDYCPLIRLEKNGFKLNEKKEILSNLKKLKNLVLQQILSKYDYSISDKAIGWKSEFFYNQESGKTNSTKREIKQFLRESTEIDVIHEQIKSKLETVLIENPFILGKDYEIDDKSIVHEHPVNKINFIDLVAKTKTGKIIFFEIKTASSARLCIRQALGQLMEYSYFPNEKGHADKLVVVGIGVKDKNIKSYIKKLNSDFKINIDYLSISI